MRLLKICAATVAMLALAGTAQATPAITSFTGGTIYSSYSGDRTIGWQFTVAAGAGITVDALGWW